MKYSSQAFMPTATLCIPYYIDHVPVAKRLESYYSWQETAKTLVSILNQEQNLSNIFSCPVNGQLLNDASLESSKNTNKHLMMFSFHSAAN